MTYPAGDSSSVNQWGPTAPASDFVNPPAGVPAPSPATPQSPSGSVTGESATWNFANSETSTEQALNVNSVPAGTPAMTPALTTPVVIAGCASTAQNAWQESCVEAVRS
jgi:hypothetical protein